MKNGLPRDVALRLAAQTVLGSAKMTQGEKSLGARCVISEQMLNNGENMVKHTGMEPIVSHGKMMRNDDLTMI